MTRHIRPPLRSPKYQQCLVIHETRPLLILYNTSQSRARIFWQSCSRLSLESTVEREHPNFYLTIYYCKTSATLHTSNTQRQQIYKHSLTSESTKNDDNSASAYSIAFLFRDFKSLGEQENQSRHQTQRTWRTFCPRA
jgi:hypothetical protein